MSEYTKPCIYCKAEIRMSNKNEGKWLSYNLDGSAHDCKPSDQKSTDAQNHNTGGNLNREKKTLSVEERLARLEETVFLYSCRNTTVVENIVKPSTFLGYMIHESIT
jgi:hypothetical protein